ncbi:struthiocalcin-2-like [Mauremys mutica]|uniref:struthiocalcin-2-like n=1 Tax=Mauremys mutica TaxID=74926 RepID=UPI001D14860C|nr:struthiocalcin-2-like [Mauremys mutica]
MGPVAYFSLCLLGCLIFNPSLAAGAQAASCPRGWLHFHNDCYGYFPQEATWKRAEARCQSYGSGAHLASIHSEEEHNAVADFVTRSQRHDDDDDDGDDVWIGLHTPARSRRWSWADGSELDFSAWGSRGSSSSPKGEPCVVLEEDTGFMTWDKDSCNDRNPFVCKFRP